MGCLYVYIWCTPSKITIAITFAIVILEGVQRLLLNANCNRLYPPSQIKTQLELGTVERRLQPVIPSGEIMVIETEE